MCSKFYFITFITVCLFILSCHQKRNADYIIKDACIYTMNEKNDTVQAMAVINGKIVAIGSNAAVLDDYRSDSIISLRRKYLYPAFIDAHAHFFGLAYALGECNLFGSRSIHDIIHRLKYFYKNNPERKWIVGRGWDQNLFSNKSFPNKETLDSIFKDIPVCLTRVDGHAIWTNSKAIEIAGIKTFTSVNGGEILLNEQNEPSGIFIDNATQLIEQYIPKFSKKELLPLLKKAEKLCWENNIHCVHDAGLDLWQIQLLDSLQKTGELKIKIYAMALFNHANLNYFLKNGLIEKERLKVKSFKIYSDGALGSRGALLKQKYADIDETKQRNEFGLLLIGKDSLDKILKLLYEKNFQVCTHAIGDSANALILEMYARHLRQPNNKRWRIEHAQIVDKKDLHYFKRYNIIPSVQPTHAISDRFWAMKRLGVFRLSNAYAYQSLWQQNQLLALGTDFPVEEVSPLKTFFAAVFRRNYDLSDTVSFQSNEALSRLQTLRGMTIDAAYAAFMEKEIGSLETGKYADFIILDFDLMKISREELSQAILNDKSK